MTTVLLQKSTGGIHCLVLCLRMKLLETCGDEIYITQMTVIQLLLLPRLTVNMSSFNLNPCLLENFLLSPAEWQRSPIVLNHSVIDVVAFFLLTLPKTVMVYAPSPPPSPPPPSLCSTNIPKASFSAI